MLCRDHENASTWTNPEWSGLLRTGRDKKRMKDWLNSDGFIHDMRAIQAHKFRTDGVSTFITLVFSLKMLSVIHAGLIVGDAKEGWQTVSSPPWIL